MSSYSLIVKNESKKTQRFVVFHKVGELMASIGEHTLAWLSKYAYPGTTIDFGWNDQYSAIWSCSRQKMQPGIICKTGQQKAVDFNGLNTVTLNYDRVNDAFNFGEVTEGSPGSITITCDEAVPNDPLVGAGVGIAMSGSGICLFDANPNSSFSWSLEPKCYIVVGDFKAGEVLDIEALMKSGTIQELPYKERFKHHVTFNENNEWDLK